MYQFGSLTVKKSEIQPLSQKQLISKTLTEERGIFNATKDYTQQDIKKIVPPQLQNQMFQLNLSQGPYMSSYEPSGQHVLITGQNSHISLIRLEDFTPIYEKHLDMRCFCSKFLTNSELQAFGRKNAIGITNFQGNEVHRIKRPSNVNALEYLQNHLVLADSCGSMLSYTDITTGKTITQKSLKHSISSLTTDPKTALVGISSFNSTLFTTHAPSIDTPVYAINLNHIPNKVKFSLDGNYLLSQGEGKVKIFDIRQTKQEICSIRHDGICQDFDVSQSGKLAILTQFGVGVNDVNGLISRYNDSNVVRDETGEMHVYFDQKYEIYHQTKAKNCQFRPFFDNLMLTGINEVEQILTPGAGSADFTTYQANQYSSTKSRNEQLIRNQLDKLPVDLIGQSSVLNQIKSLSIEQSVQQKNDLLLQQIAGKLSKKVRKDKPKTVKQKQQKVRHVRKIQLQMEDQILQLKNKNKETVNNGGKIGLDRFERME